MELSGLEGLAGEAGGLEGPQEGLFGRHSAEEVGKEDAGGRISCTQGIHQGFGGRDGERGGAFRPGVRSQASWGPSVTPRTSPG